LLTTNDQCVRSVGSEVFQPPEDNWVLWPVLSDFYNFSIKIIDFLAYFDFIFCCLPLKKDKCIELIIDLMKILSSNDKIHHEAPNKSA